MRYRIRYYWTDNPKHLKSRSQDQFAVNFMDFDCSAPITAINQFHRRVQNTTLRAQEGHIIRPALKPDQYRVLSMHQVYHDTSLQRDVASTPIIESLVDYPASPNPLVCDADKRKGDPAFAVSSGPEEFNFGTNPTQNP